MLYQFLPRLSDDEYRELEASIREHGVQVPIVVDEHRAVIDGHHRKEIADRLGVECPRRLAMDLTDEQKRTLALSLNLHRRHLSRDQKRELVEKSLKADPHLSDRQHAERTGVSHPTVGKVRDELEDSEQLESFTSRTSADGRERPATQPERPGDIVDAQLVDDEPPAPRATPRRALPDQFFDAAYDAARKLESLHRLTGDDRFPQNAKKIAAKHRNDLLRTHDLLQQVINSLPETEATK